MADGTPAPDARATSRPRSSAGPSRRFLLAGATVLSLLLVVLLLRVAGSDGEPAGTTAAGPNGASGVDGVPLPSPEAAPEITPDSVAWSDAATWGGSMPKASTKVVIPSGKKVVLDVSPPPITDLQIDGTLTFARKNLTLTAEAIMVHGALVVGTTEAPFQQRARIVLTGKKSTRDYMGMGTKVLGVMGSLDLHGLPRNGWTRLDATAASGSKTLTLEKSTGWRVGDRIVVSSTDFSSEQAEERAITAVDGAKLTLDNALRYRHWGTKQTIAGKTLDERAEVGLLSRNITVEGDRTSSKDGFGGHTMVMGQARIEGVEFVRMGQKGALRRYPVHFHMLGDAPKSYVKNSSLHDTFNRCITIHGTNDTTVSGNVCQDFIGHGIFLEDGAETGNRIESNLVLTARKPAEGQALLPSDNTPASFWITNPDNIVRNNVAGGGEGHGFWVALAEHPTGLSKTTKIWPQRTPLRSFTGNTAHSNGRNGLHVDDGPTADGSTTVTWFTPVKTPSKQDSKPVVADFARFTGFKNRDQGVWLRGGNTRMTGAVLADNAIGATFASSETFLVGSFVVGESANTGTPAPYEKRGAGGRSLPRPWQPEFPIRGFEFYDGKVGTESTTFANFTPNSIRPASGLGYKLDNPFPIHVGNFAQDLRFVDAQPMYAPTPGATKDGDLSAVFQDLDGSVSGKAGATVVANNAFLRDSSCQVRTEWNVAVCELRMTSLRVAADGNPGAVSPVVLRRGDGVTQTLSTTGGGASDANTSVFAGKRYAVEFTGGTPANTSYVLRNGKGKWVELSMPYASAPKVTRYGCDVTDPKSYCSSGRPGSLAELAKVKKSGFYYDAGAKTLYLRIVGGDADYEELKVSPR